jgi:hypothetical protein
MSSCAEIDHRPGADGLVDLPHHAGRAITEPQRVRFVAAFLDTADEPGWPEDPRFRRRLLESTSPNDSDRSPERRNPRVCGGFMRG